MSTRAVIIIKDAFSRQCFYRHSDGYPSVTLPSLESFLNWVEEGRIRDNVSQAAGWLVVLGIKEYSNGFMGKRDGSCLLESIEPGPVNSMSGWKVGAYEPIQFLPGDDVGQEFEYTIDLVAKMITVVDIHAHIEEG